MFHMPLLKIKSKNFKSERCSECFSEKILSFSLYEIMKCDLRCYQYLACICVKGKRCPHVVNCVSS